MKIDKIYIITYDKNIDKIGRVFNQLINIGYNDIHVVKGINKDDLDIRDYGKNGTKVRYYYGGKLETVWLKNGSVIPNNCACMISHKIAFENAKKEGYDNIMVVEDDLMLGYKVGRYLKPVLDKVPNDWDMLRLEWNLAVSMGEINLVNEYWFTCDNVRSTAWMIFNQKAINKILEIMNDRPIGSFDQLTNRQCDDLNSYTSIWSMGIQYPL